ncbi:MAG TPA: hypothetical protein P5081_14500 [Phycisphaerae bacterium]|nr:hypothetical protein [Phycisphaerae bacterium]HRW54080.1 hypothetical protein [Phycisphaerae bacterium]
MMARRNYIIELRHLVFWGVFAGMFEGTISSIVVSKTFNAGDWLITFVMATPMLANLLGGVWGSVLTGRHKLRLFIGFGFAAAVVIASVALAPMSPAGGYVFAAQILLARAFLAGCVTARSAIWKHNYPTAMRGQIAARLQIVRFSMAIAVVLTVGALFDWRPDIYVWIYPSTAFVGGVALLLLRPMRIRGERTEIAAIHRSRASQPRRQGHTLLAPFRQGLGVLRDDRDYRRYCVGMMFLGFANIMVMPLMTIIVTKELTLSYKASSTLLEVTPRLLMMVSMLPWARLFDKRGVVHFRISNAIAWTSASVFGGVATFMIHSRDLSSTTFFAAVMLCLTLSRVCDGLGKGGGAIAWNLGHLHFARPEQAEIYMGVHVFLTGTRGLTAPFFGTWLYKQTGAFAFVVAVTLGATGMLIFRSLARAQRERSDANLDPSAAVA